ncbi:hypothetical protein [Marinactinospora rubrisoli]|uniref:SMI1/KNR4 family protein n=1 Tax=Marinactinospora rubrisoli TaxID=2715399 RepID=A0ABW2KNI7_9ACTN
MMSDRTPIAADHPFEERYARMLHELRTSPHVDLEHEARGPVDDFLADPERVFHALAEEYRLPVAAAFRPVFFRQAGLGVFWRSVPPLPLVVGEFHLRHVYLSAIREPVPWLADQVTDEHAEVAAELRVMDDTPQGGSGRFAALRTTPGTAESQIWLYDMSHDHRAITPLEVDYRGYLEALLLTRGFSGWQYLYADVPLGAPEFRGIRRTIEEALEVLPKAFPGDDHTPLFERFERRS